MRMPILTRYAPIRQQNSRPEDAQAAQREDAMTNIISIEPTELTTQPHQRNPALVYRDRLAPGSHRTMWAALETIAATCSGDRVGASEFPWHILRYEHTRKLRADLAARYAPATTNKLLAALRGVLKECWRLGLMSHAAYARATDLEAVSGSRVPTGRALSSGELTALLRTCETDPRPAGARDAAIFACMYPGGLRRAEVVFLDWGDYATASGALTVQAGKRNKGRIVYLTGGAARAMHQMIQRFIPFPIMNYPLFC